MTHLIPVLQTAIGPVILISGVGLLILSMTNRLGRSVDRARLIGSQMDETTKAQRPPLEAQLRILWKRARVLRAAIALAAGSALAAALLVILIFIAAITGFNAGWLTVVLFTLCMSLLIISLILFIYDINQALAALRLELRTHGLSEI